MQIITKLLVADGDIVVIGGIKKNVLANAKNQVPGLGNIPGIGNLFKGKSKSDNLIENQQSENQDANLRSKIGEPKSKSKRK